MRPHRRRRHRQVSTRTATRRSTTRWFAWRRISRSVIPLVDGQGNFGNIDGDNAAAYRYTEARLTEVARLLLDGIDEDAVDFRETYNGEDEEPVVLPAAFPNLLANGSQGIAVGMATSIPPHNAAELCDAALYLIQHPETSSEQLHDLRARARISRPAASSSRPRASMAETYRTGRGAFRVRARWQKEDTRAWRLGHRRHRDPLLVSKGRLIEKIAELLNEKKLPMLADLRDESAEDIRVVLEPRVPRRSTPQLLMESLFRLTELESRHPDEHERADRRAGAAGARARARPCVSGWTIGAWCCSGARASGSARSRSGSKSCAAC